MCSIADDGIEAAQKCKLLSCSESNGISRKKIYLFLPQLKTARHSPPMRTTGSPPSGRRGEGRNSAQQDLRVTQLGGGTGMGCILWRLGPSSFTYSGPSKTSAQPKLPEIRPPWVQHPQKISLLRSVLTSVIACCWITKVNRIRTVVAYLRRCRD